MVFETKTEKRIRKGASYRSYIKTIYTPHESDQFRILNQIEISKPEQKLKQ